MIGGYQIIDLRKIGLELKGSQQTISDAGILSQLRGLRNYIEKGHAYAKPLDNALKPIMIRYRDQKNNEKREVSSFASINNTNNSLTFTIESKHLQIEIVFEEKTDDDGNKYYDIKTAKYLYSLNEVAEGDLSVTGDASIGGDLSVTGDASIGGDLSVTGDASIGGDLEVTGDIEGDKISGNEIVENMSGYSATIYESVGGWTISNVYTGIVKNGNKLTLVSAFNIVAGAVLSAEFTVGQFTLPTNVLSKLYPTTVGGAQLLSKNKIEMTPSSDYHSTKDAVCYLQKGTDYVSFSLIIDTTGISEGATYFVRIEATFLLSDNLISNE